MRPAARVVAREADYESAALTAELPAPHPMLKRNRRSLGSGPARLQTDCKREYSRAAYQRGHLLGRALVEHSDWRPPVRSAPPIVLRNAYPRPLGGRWAGITAETQRREPQATYEWSSSVYGSLLPDLASPRETK